MSDITISRPQRTYPLPVSVVEAARQGLRWQQAYGTAVSEATSWSAGILAGGGSATEELIVLLASLTPDNLSINWSETVKEPTSDMIVWSMHGGNALADWALRVIQAGAAKVSQKTSESLEKCAFDPDMSYFGILDAENDCLIRSMVRASGTSWDRWDRSAGWTSTSDVAMKYDAVELDRDLVAFCASALADSDGVLLMFAEPRAHLLHEPILSAAPDDVKGAHYYAIVDGTDTTAVMDLIRIAPGPIVSVRQNKTWVVSAPTLTLLTSIAPPPLVELDPDMLKLVIAQIDGNGGNPAAAQAAQDPTYVESIGNEHNIDPALAAKSASPAAPVAAGGYRSAIDDADRRLEAIIASFAATVQVTKAIDLEDTNWYLAELQNAGDNYVRRTELQSDERARRDRVRTLLAGLDRTRDAQIAEHRGRTSQLVLDSYRSLRTRLAMTETIADAVPVTADGGPDRNRGNAETLRRYWTRGEGAVKIKWGVGGDWYRCVRQLTPYLGTRAKGYCTLRHHDATGAWPGHAPGESKPVAASAGIRRVRTQGGVDRFDQSLGQIIAPKARLSDRRIKVRLGRHKTMGASLEHYVTSDGHLTDERAALHRNIVDQMLAGVEPNPNGKTYHFMGGGTASGKSTMTDSMAHFPKPGEAVFVDSDSVKTKLPEYNQMMADGDSKAAIFVHAESLMIAEAANKIAQKRGLDVVLDGTGAGSPYTVIGRIDAAKAAGYTTHGNYATIPTKMAIERSNARGRSSGRYVPESIIRSRHASVSSTFETVAPHFDTVHLYDTTDAARPIFKVINGHREILDPAAYKQFLRKAHE